MNKYKPVCKIGAGTFSDVLKMLSLRDGKYYACKCMKQHFKSIEQVNNLSEIQALRRLNPHPNILTLHEIVFDKKAGCLSLICELMDMNIYELIKGRRKPLSEKKIKNYMYQLCKSLDHIHRNGIFHRDVKPENILIKQNTLKLADFGSCRTIYSKQPYTEYISTRWYRAPECLLTNGYYSYKMDVWSAGCVFYEITSFQPLFPGSNDLDQISKIHDVIGTPANRTLNKFKQAADTQALATHKKHSLRKAQEKAKRQHGFPCGELPMLRPSGAANLPSLPTPTSQSVFPAAKKSGATSVLQSVRFIGSNMEVQILTCSLMYNKIGFMEHILNFCCFFNSLRNRRPFSLP
ncbi:MAPK/MAK/MRK overlapping kinase isoform X2 [Tympanuchus pallidicinctus]|uniref:MAPK/MAK/MRK overlapping kinase isoform X2 n=1 Tax=Tympanuchus pallidicinctus TaxID=109042 RepID=UPI0022874DA1|nr:MAPK/MAK/MRK overlapping kinase isoform X2 [Tympanuchus pallidicinctus]